MSSQLYPPRSRDQQDARGLAPRPASSHFRAGGQAGEEPDNPDNIGRAISVDMYATRRRSRSLSELPVLTNISGLRNRSEEIRYWRESYNPGFFSPVSTEPNEAPEPSEPELSPRTPLQPFNFETMKGMKITAAVSLEERFNTLEAKNQKLEKLVAKLFQLVPGVQEYADVSNRARAPVVEAPLDAPNPSGLDPVTYRALTNRDDARGPYGDAGSRHSIESFGGATTFVGSIHPATTDATKNTNTTRQGARPTSTATIRAATSLPTIPRGLSGPFTADHYTTLLALIDTERSARQALETEVTRLRHQLGILTGRAQQHLLAGHGTSSVAYSYFEHDEEDDDNAQPGDDEYSGSETFKTPNEDKPHGFGAFGEELVEGEMNGSRKKAARTLSLSQLTLKRPTKPESRPALPVDL
jgi:hypothetical protein